MTFYQKAEKHFLNKKFTDGPKRPIDHLPYFKPHLVLIKNIKGSRVEIYSQPDVTHQGHRHSYTVRTPGRGVCASGGYGQNNEIIYPTIGSALLDSLKHVTYNKEELKVIRREILLNEIL